MIVNMTDKDVYLQIKAIFEGCDTLLDAIPFGNQYCEQYPHLKDMISSYMYSRHYMDTLDIKTKQSSLCDVDRAKYRDDALFLTSKLTQGTQDDVFKKTLERLSSRKDFNKRDSRQKEEIKLISKKCPHCQHTITMPDHTDYVICGYHDNVHGYDWKGCGRDWCFQCEKILCKKWESDMLMMEENKTHCSDCCSKHSILNNHNYPDDYCQCLNVHNMRFF